MMLSINLLNAELSTFQGELPAVPVLPADAARPVGGFAELLGLRVMLPEPELLAGPADALVAAGGETLPDTGNSLPRSEAPETGEDLELVASMVAVPIPIPVPLPPATVTAVSVSAADTAENFDLPLSGSPVERRDLPLPEPQRVVTPAGLPVAMASPAGAAAAMPLQPVTSGLPELNRAWQLAPGAVLPATAKEGEILLPLDGEVEGEMPLPRIDRSGARDNRQPAQHNDSGRQLFESFKAFNASEQRASPLTVAAASAPTGDALARIAQAPAAALGPEVAPALAAGNTVQAAAAPQAAAPSLPRIDLPLHDPAWADALHERVTFMAGKDLRNAEIRLHPAELGPIRVQVSVDDRGTNVSFIAHHAATREAIEQALPRLRELFTDQGLSLGQASVSEQGVKHDRGGQGEERAASKIPDPVADDAEEPVVAGRQVRSGAGQVDTFV